MAGKNSGTTPAERQIWREGIYDQTREVMSLQDSLSIERMCSALVYSLQYTRLLAFELLVTLQILLAKADGEL